jgi:hypothetical protein
MPAEDTPLQRESPAKSAADVTVPGLKREEIGRIFIATGELLSCGSLVRIQPGSPNQ